MKTFLLLLTAIVLFENTSVFSQDISQYLNDGGVSQAKSIISIGYDPLNGVLPISFERLLVSRLSLVVGGGPVWLKIQGFLSPDDPLPIKHTGIGYTAFIKAKVYFRQFPERFYTAIYPRFTVMDNKLFMDIALVNAGYQRIVFRKIILGAEAGVVFRFYNDSMEAGSSTQIQLPVTVNFGYLF